MADAVAAIDLLYATLGLAGIGGRSADATELLVGSRSAR